MSAQQQEQQKLFVIYTAKNGTRIPEKVIITGSKNDAIKQANQEFGIADVVDGAVAPVEDLVRYILPTMMMVLIGVQQLIAIIAQDAQERTVERSKNQLNLVRGPN